MLVLSRKTGQKLIINDNIEITILETKGDFVKLGIEAPRDVSIYREEIYAEIRDSNRQSATPTDESDVEAAMNLLRKNMGAKSNTEISAKFKLPLNKVKKKD